MDSPADWLTSIGLVLDVIGVLLLWRYGLPERVSRTGESSILLADEIDEAWIAKAARYDRLAIAGIGLVVGGFLLQLVAHFF